MTLKRCPGMPCSKGWRMVEQEVGMVEGGLLCGQASVSLQCGSACLSLLSTLSASPQGQNLEVILRDGLFPAIVATLCVGVDQRDLSREHSPPHSLGLHCPCPAVCLPSLCPAILLHQPSPCPRSPLRLLFLEDDTFPG